MKSSYFVLIGTFVTCVASQALAQRSGEPRPYHLIESTINIARGETISLPLDRSRYIKHVGISAFGRGEDAMFEVVVNGEIKGTVFVPGRDPDYIVTISDVAESIVLRHLSGATVAVTTLTAYVYDRQYPGPSVPSEEIRSHAAQLCQEVIQSTKTLEDFAVSEEVTEYLLPVRVAAGRAYASATASGDLSQRVHQRLQVLQSEMRAAGPFIDRALAGEDSFAAAVDFLTLKERLDELMDKQLAQND